MTVGTGFWRIDCCATGASWTGAGAWGDGADGLPVSGRLSGAGAGAADDTVLRTGRFALVDCWGTDGADDWVGCLDGAGRVVGAVLSPVEVRPFDRAWRWLIAAPAAAPAAAPPATLLAVV